MADDDDWGKAEVGVTWDTYVELGKPAGVKVFTAASIEEDGAYVCSGYALGEPFMMPGNIVRSCSACGHPIQLRPHAPAGLRLVCVPCALAAGMRMPSVGEISGGKLWRPRPKAARNPIRGRKGRPPN